MNFPKLEIGKLRPKYPIIQGGMAIKVSLSRLASAVANEGGIGVIAGTALPIDELKNEIKKAKEMTKGIIGVNLMYAASDFMNSLKASIDSGIDVIISGAGFSKDMFSITREAGVPVIPIVSSLKLAKISERLGAAAVVVEGGNAGGHLGTDQNSWEIVKKIKESLKIPVIAAGDIVNAADVQKMMQMGVDGVQMGTRFVASLESEVSQAFKELCVKSNDEDVITIMSSVGLRANAIRTPFSQLVLDGKAPKPEKCTNCLKYCLKTFCIKDALLGSLNGDVERGVFFTGKGISKIKEILSVQDIFKELVEAK